MFLKILQNSKENTCTEAYEVFFKSDPCKSNFFLFLCKIYSNVQYFRKMFFIISLDIPRSFVNRKTVGGGGGG